MQLFVSAKRPIPPPCHHPHGSELQECVETCLICKRRPPSSAEVESPPILFSAEKFLWMSGIACIWRWTFAAHTTSHRGDDPNVALSADDFSLRKSQWYELSQSGRSAGIAFNESLCGRR